MSHGDRITKNAAEALSSRQSRANAPFAVIPETRRANIRADVPPEVVTRRRRQLSAFRAQVAGLTGDWTMRAFREEAIERSVRRSAEQSYLRPLRRRRFRGRGGL